MLADLIDKPVYLDSIVVGDMYDHDALKRALYGRLENLKGNVHMSISHVVVLTFGYVDLPKPYKLHRPRIYHTDIEFESSKLKMEEDNKGTVIPSGTSKGFYTDSLLFTAHSHTLHQPSYGYQAFKSQK